ncbi:perforin-1-like [Boleophthalmus pectinirostris]|uniref:perforin-1-like n=1 Tax=Boleophthalmus pectinirostris TaxID=150288 RepID=UPI00242AC8CB|nr:perforin-1-like [Boleophthalmus pectinirostris]
MAKMGCTYWLLLLLGLLAPLCEPSTVRYGPPSECSQAPMVPGYNLGGEGFNIVTMERKGAYVIDTDTWDLGNGTCKLYPNSFMGGQMQKVPVAVVDWRALSECHLSVSSTSYDSVETLVNDSTSSVSNNWKLGLNISIPVDPSVVVSVRRGLGGSHSKVAKFAMQKSKQDRYNFYRHSVYCSTYRYRMTPAPPVSKHFQSEVNSLPAYSPQSANQYRRVIETYGTHYITQVFLGGEIKAITSVRTCQASVNGLTESEVSNCLSVEASANVEGIGGFNAMAEHCKAKSKELGHDYSFSKSFSERFTETTGGRIAKGATLFTKSDPTVFDSWLTSLGTSPDVVKYDLKPLHTILSDNHRAKNGIKKEIETYIKQNALFKKCSESCTIGHKSSPRDPCTCVCNSNPNLRSNCCPTGLGKATLRVYRLYANDLYGDVWSKTDGSVEVIFDEQVKHTAIIHENNNPKWSEKFEFGAITINMKNKLQFKVYDYDSYWNSDLLGECSVDLRRGKVSDTCMLNHGTLFFSYEVTCAPSLGGEQCQEYISSPLSSSVSKSFYTRNGVLGKDLE